MKRQYPPMPKFIIGNKTSQLWVIIPVCILLTLCNNVGIIGSCLIFIIWFIYAHITSKNEWMKACQNGYATIYSSQSYLVKNGFYENHLNDLQTVHYVVDSEQDNYIDKLKNELEVLIINNHNNAESVQDMQYKQNLYKQIMQYYHVEFGHLPDNAYEILKHNGNLYQVIKRTETKSVQDYDYYKQFKKGDE